jgi:glutamine amidotransferase
MIAIIDYGVGNLGSVAKAFAYLGYPARITTSPAEVLEAERVVLPGVGAFGKSMEYLTKAGMVPVVKEVIASNRPFLGICLGFQMLFEESMENFDDQASSLSGLGIFPGQVLKFPASELKIPQIGWNSIRKAQDSPLFYGVEDGSYVYFVHSYYVKPAAPDLISCQTEYGIEYCSGISRGNVHAVQFHPEKSSRTGLAMLKNFAELK